MSTDYHQLKRDCLDGLRQVFHQSLWYRHKTAAKDSLRIWNNIDPFAKTEKDLIWYWKASVLLDWLLQDGNQQLWKRERKTLPYERCTREYHNWRIECLNRDDWKCQDCGKTKDLQVHHIKHYKTHQDLRLNRDNGITLCQDCHMKAHGKTRQKNESTTRKTRASHTAICPE